MNAPRWIALGLALVALGLVVKGRLDQEEARWPASCVEVGGVPVILDGSRRCESRDAWTPTADDHALTLKPSGPASRTSLENFIRPPRTEAEYDEMCRELRPPNADPTRGSVLDMGHYGRLHCPPPAPTEPSARRARLSGLNQVDCFAAGGAWRWMNTTGVTGGRCIPAVDPGK